MTTATSLVNPGSLEDVGAKLEGTVGNTAVDEKYITISVTICKA